LFEGYWNRQAELTPPVLTSNGARGVMIHAGFIPCGLPPTHAAAPRVPRRCDRFRQLGTAAGAIRTDIRPTDIGGALEGIAFTSAGAEHRKQAERLLDLTLDGLTVRP
jgi:hypothetical protein